MDNQFDTTDFEDTLMESADQFILIPSKRVWQGIYNDLHPGSRWPSLAMGLVFLFSLIGIGHLNNSSKNVLADYKIPSGEIALNTSSPAGPYIKNAVHPFGNTLNDISKVDHKKNERLSPEKNFANPGTDKSKSGKLFASDLKMPDAGLNKLMSITQSLLPTNIDDEEISKNLIQSSSVTNDRALPNISELIAKSPQHYLGDRAIIENNLSNTLSSLPDVIRIQNAKDLSLLIPADNENSFLSSEQKEITRATSSKIIRKKNDRITWNYFITPSISTAYFSGKPLAPVYPSAYSGVVVNPTNTKNNMTYNARIGLTTGAVMAYSLNSKVKILVGGKASYIGYGIVADEVHPVFASVGLKDKSGNIYSKSYVTHFGNGLGFNQFILNNYTLQLSVPAGLQFVLLDNKQLQINFASTIDPSLLLKGNAYMLSSDGLYYVSDNDLRRKINLNGNLETFISFKPGKIRWQLGPVIRYQVLSTYLDNYPVKEHLVDYGFKIGISR